MKARRYSRQRTLILETLRRNPVHPTADEVYRLVQQEDPHLSLGTVYRNLNLLSQDGVIQSLRSDKNCERFDGNPAPHYHFRCETCGRELIVPRIKLEKKIKRIISE